MLFFSYLVLPLNVDYMNKESEGETKKTTNKDMSYIYQEQKVQPCHLSSSIYYGGQDIYSHPSSTRDSGLNTTVGDYIHYYLYHLFSNICLKMKFRMLISTIILTNSKKMQHFEWFLK
jgi:hypothetical protein